MRKQDKYNLDWLFKNVAVSGQSGIFIHELLEELYTPETAWADTLEVQDLLIDSLEKMDASDSDIMVQATWILPDIDHLNLVLPEKSVTFKSGDSACIDVLHESLCTGLHFGQRYLSPLWINDQYFLSEKIFTHYECYRVFEQVYTDELPPAYSQKIVRTYFHKGAGLNWYLQRSPKK